jgi:glycosyltransferase involved in cell wall biosynthesis
MKVGIFTNIAPLYVEPLWKLFLNSNDIIFTFISSENGYKGINVIDPTIFLKDQSNINRWRFVKNIYFGRSLIYQKGVLKEVIKNEFDIYIFYGEMYTITTWIASIICHLKKKKVFFWGHGYYGNEKHLKKYIRTIFYKLADYHFIYGNRSRQLLITEGFNSDKIFTVYNSLNYYEHSKIYKNRNLNELKKIKEQLFPNRSQFPVLLFIGRLTKVKKINLLIDSIEILKKNGKEFNCILIGDGDEKEALINLVNTKLLQDSIYFYGPCYDDAISGKLVMLADCCVSPGNIGLTAIHSLALGTPVITHGNLFNQMPEVEAVFDGKTGYYFEEDNIDSLVIKIDLFSNTDKKNLMEQECLSVIKAHFTPENQFNIITSALKASYP